MDEGWLEVRRPQDGTVHPAPRRVIRQVLGDVPEIQGILMASPEREWPLGLSNAQHHPPLRGLSVVAAWLNRGLKPKVYVYPVPEGQWPGEAAVAFASDVLPGVRQWLLSELSKSETQLFEPLQLVVVWSDGAFEQQEVVMRGRPLP